MKDVVNIELKYEDFRTFLFNRSNMRHEMNSIQSKYPNIALHRVDKIYLSFCYDKKYILRDGDRSLLHFHKSTR